MKTFLLLITLLSASGLIFAEDKYAALAVGFNGPEITEGTSWDQTSKSQAIRQALKQCGSECDTVKVISGGQCLAFRTTHHDLQDSWAWGEGINSEDADKSAFERCQKGILEGFCGSSRIVCNETGEMPPINTTREDLARAITKFYDNEGRWAGQYKLAKVESMRFRLSDESLDVTTFYKYVPTGKNTNSAGEDMWRYSVQIVGGELNVSGY